VSVQIARMLDPDTEFQAVFFVSQDVSGELDASLEIVPCSQVIQMEDDPLVAVRRKKESSLCQGLKYLKEARIDAFVSAGNTGALLLAAKTTLKTLPGIARPAMLALLPTKKKEVAVLDVGANLTIKPHHIVQFAAMGIAYQKSRGIAKPTVGLLNIGAEAKKGTRKRTRKETLNFFISNRLAENLRNVFQPLNIKLPIKHSEGFCTAFSH